MRSPARSAVALILAAAVLLPTYLMTKSRKSDTTALIADAEGFIKENKFQEAILKLTPAVKQEPKNIQAPTGVARKTVVPGDTAPDHKSSQRVFQPDPGFSGDTGTSGASCSCHQPG